MFIKRAFVDRYIIFGTSLI